MEILDIYNDNFELIGNADRKKVHQLGMWHQVVACLVINSNKNTAFFQRKYPATGFPINDKYSPLDITVGGHYETGEKREDCVREIEEELKIDINYSDLFYLGLRQCSATVSEDFIINEFHQVFLLQLNKNLKEYDISGNEVCGLVEVKIDETINLILGKTKKIIGKELYINNGVQKIRNKTITYNSFIKCWMIKDQFILRLLIAAKRYINEENKELIKW